MSTRFEPTDRARQSVDTAQDECDYDVAKARVRSRYSGMTATMERTRLLIACMKAKGFRLVSLTEEWK